MFDRSTVSGAHCSNGAEKNQFSNVIGGYQTEKGLQAYSEILSCFRHLSTDKITQTCIKEESFKFRKM